MFALTDKNKETLENYTKLWYQTKNKIEAIRGIEPIEFESDDDLPLGKILNIPVCAIIVKTVFKKMTNIIHKFIYMNVFMGMNMNMKMILIPLYK